MRILTGILCIACAACTHTPEEDAAAALSFACSGSEPFWALSIEDDNATLTTPSDEGIENAAMAGGWADADLSDGAVLWRGQGASFSIAQRQCFSEAGEAFEYEIDLAPLFPKSPAAPGCCRRVN